MASDDSSEKEARSLIHIWAFLAALATMSGLILLNHFANVQIDTEGHGRFAWSGWAGIVVRAVAPEVIGTLLIYLAINWLLKRQRKLFNESTIDKIGKKVAEQLRQSDRQSFDDTLTSKQRDAEVIRNSHADLWVAQRTGKAFLSDSRDELVEHLQTKRKLKLIVTSPNSVGSAHLLFGRTDVGRHLAFGAVTSEAKRVLESIFAKCREPQKQVELRYCPYALPAAVVLSDPEISRRSHLTYRLGGFLAKLSFQKKVNLETDSDASPQVIKSVIEAYREVFHLSSKVVVLPPVGRDCLTALRYMMPEFWGRSPQFKRDPDVRHIAAVDSDNVFMIWFEDVEGDPWRSYVRYGAANRKSTRDEFTIADSELDWKVSRDTFRDMLLELEKAISLRKVIVFGNLGSLQLGQVDDPKRIEVVPSSLFDGNTDFYSERLEKGETVFQLSLSAMIGKLLEDHDSHVYFDLKNELATNSSPIYGQIMNHERTTELEVTDIPTVLQSEIEGSIRCVSFSRLASPGH